MCPVSVEPEAPGQSFQWSDEELTRHLLEGVSRTFALTIPELPDGLFQVVANGYLLCRIADTIEDEPGLDQTARRRLHEQFSDAVEGRAGSLEFARALEPRLTESTLESERELIRHVPRVLAITHAFSARQRAALSACVRTMCRGMDRFQPSSTSHGLKDVQELSLYCYYVAGVVGEMLTELFCESSPSIDARRDLLEQKAVSFGLGLQMTNILKDIWEDLERGFCWLPRDLFAAHGFDLDDLEPGLRSAAFEAALADMIAIAHGHLRNALDYVLLIPSTERGIRRFCLWALGMAVLTLRKIDGKRGFRSGNEVKISRRTVKATVFASNVTTRNNRLLKWLFAACSAGLPGPQPTEVVIP